MSSVPARHRPVPAWYFASVAEFLEDSDAHVISALFQAGGFDVVLEQRHAWVEQLALLRPALQQLTGWIALEFEVPRLGSRIDAVVVTGGAIVPIEFKIGERAFTRAAMDQVWDYALDLKNFHSGSHEADIFPLIVATEATRADSHWRLRAADRVRTPRRCLPATLIDALTQANAESSGPDINGRVWGGSLYQPTPTIIEAARALYGRNSVAAITRNDAGAQNLSTTATTVEEIITVARRDRLKAIVFITGVPGAGKTLIGLDVATRHRRADQSTHAVYLSGNGPLVAVLLEALTRDEWERRKAASAESRKGDVAGEVKQFIQNVHHWRDEGVRTLESNDPPVDHVVIFDEAQRAWNLAKTADFMKRRKQRLNFDRSESQFLLEYMDRHEDWAVVVCLVGGGQEIHTGEAGIGAWLDALREHFPAWRTYISPKLVDREYDVGDALERLDEVSRVERRPELHLAVSMRSFRSERVSEFVKAVLDVEAGRARELLRAMEQRYPIALTRDLGVAKSWIRGQARGNERFGLVATATALRLKPHAVDVRAEINPVHWFLSGRDDVRSSCYLEDAATQYHIQGLELDWVLVTWDADLRFNGTGWDFRRFGPKNWKQVHVVETRQFMLNAYRVLLTRARQGMVIFVPPGDAEDPTRLPSMYDSTFGYLQEIGIPLLTS